MKFSRINENVLSILNGVLKGAKLTPGEYELDTEDSDYTSAEYYDIKYPGLKTDYGFGITVFDGKDFTIWWDATPVETPLHTPAEARQQSQSSVEIPKPLSKLTPDVWKKIVKTIKDEYMQEESISTKSMKYVKTFESFINESLNEAEYTGPFKVGDVVRWGYNNSKGLPAIYGVIRGFKGKRFVYVSMIATSHYSDMFPNRDGDYEEWTGLKDKQLLKTGKVYTENDIRKMADKFGSRIGDGYEAKYLSYWNPENDPI